MRQRGALMAELLVAMAILIGALIPIAYAFNSEKRLARARYQKAVAMEIVDGEMETLVAGEWRAFPEGTQEYTAHSQAVTNLPPGRFWLTIDAGRVRLEWKPLTVSQVGVITREVILK